MPCPTCSHTMQSVAPCVHWCPRCGTVKGNALPLDFGVPKLVVRCRAFQLLLFRTGDLPACRVAWASLGIAESLHANDAG